MRAAVDMSDGTNGWSPAGHCAIFVCDIVSFGDQARHDRIQRHLRSVLYEQLRQSFDASGAPLAGCYHEDRGDGVIVVVPPGIETALLVSPLADHLRAGLRRHNEISSDVAQIRLRVALHVGEVHQDGPGIVGTAVNHVNRLIEAPRFKDALNAAKAQFGLIVSPEVFNAVIRRGEGLIDPDEYLPVEVDVKETRTTAWMRIPGSGSREPPPSQELEPRDVGPPTSARTLHIIGRPGSEVPSLALFEIVDRLLDVPIMATQEGREQMVGLLRRDIATRIPRRAQARLDTYSILRTCLDFPEGLAELVGLVRIFAGESVPMRALEETIDRLTSGPADMPPPCPPP
jgi:class 3 adenylate cyclase